MKDELISFETAKLAKEKGFKLQSNPFGYVTKFYNHNTGALLSYGRTGRTDLSKAYYAPTQSLLQKWLREEYNIFVFVEPTLGEDLGMFAVYATDKEQNDLKLNLGYESSYQAKTYEEALEKGLYQALLLI
jgi:hypothetical protein